MTDSRLSMDNDRRYPLRPISDNKTTSQAHFSQLPAVNPPLKDAQKYNKSTATTPRACNKENTNRQAKILQKAPSEPVNGNSKLYHNEKLSKGKQRNEKNQRDLNKSLANLIRVPGKSPSGDEAFARQAVNVQKEFNSQTNFGTPVYSSVRCTPEQQRRGNPLQAPLATEYYGEDSHYFKKGKYQQGRNGVSIAEFKNQFRHGGNQERQDMFPNFNARQLLTEGDTPVGRDAYMGVSFAAAQYNIYPQQQDSVSYALGERNFGPKVNSGAKLMTEASKRVPLDVHEKRDSQNFENFFDGIKYTAGGVGRSTGEKRERKQEGEPLDWEANERECHTQGSSEKKRVTFISEKTMKKYRPEFLKIKQDIEKRKRSLDEIEKIFMAHDENGSFAKGMAEIKNHEIFTSISSKGKSPYYVHQSQPTQPTYSTFQTQPAQFTTEDVSSPSFPSLHTLPSGSKSIYAKESRMLDRTISENEREKALTKMACCGSNAGCQMF